MPWTWGKTAVFRIGFRNHFLRQCNTILVTSVAIIWRAGDRRCRRHTETKYVILGPWRPMPTTLIDATTATKATANAAAVTDAQRSRRRHYRR